MTLDPGIGDCGASTYRLLFDAATSGYGFWSELAVFGLASMLLLVLARGRSGRPRNTRMRIVASVVLTTGAFVITFHSHLRIRAALRNETYRTIQGVIVDVFPPRVYGKETIFTVRTQRGLYRYSFSPSQYTGGLRLPPRDVALLRHGRCVRIADVGGVIGRLELGAPVP